MNWQPIETAPQEAMSILLAIRGRVRQGFWVKHPNGGFWAWYGYPGVRAARANQPTHWMPLPEPPADAR